MSLRTRVRLLELGLLHDEAHAQKYDRADFVALSAWVYPTATESQLQVCHDWHMWLFCFDDRVDSLDGRYAGRLEEMEAVAIHALAALRYGIPHPEPLAIYALQIREALLALAGERWVRAFAGSECPNNLVHAVMVERGLAFPEAAAWCIDAINERYAAYLGLSERVLARDAALAPFVAGMRVWIEASADWELESGRYRSRTSPFQELRVG